MKKKFAWIILIILVVAGYGFYLFLKNKPTEIKIMPVERKTLVATISEEGVVRAVNEASLSFKATGRVASILDEGTPVKKGQTVGQLNNQEVLAQLKQAEAALAEASNNYFRDIKLKKDGIISNQQFENSQTRYESGVSQFKTAQALVDAGILQAPFDGVIAQKYVKVGELITPGAPASVVIDDRKTYLELQIDENDIPLVKAGQNIAASCDAYPDFVFKGKVVFVNHQAELKKIGGIIRPDEKDKVFRAKVAVADPDKKLKSGMTVYVDIPTEVKENVLTVPREAVLSRDGKNYIFVSQKSRVFQKLAEIGIRSLREIEITKGVTLGDQVATINLEKLKNKSRVKVIR